MSRSIDTLVSLIEIPLVASEIDVATSALRRFLGMHDYRLVALTSRGFVKRVLKRVDVDTDGHDALSRFRFVRDVYRHLPWDVDRRSVDRHAIVDDRGREWLVEAHYDRRWRFLFIPSDM